MMMRRRGLASVVLSTPQRERERVSTSPTRWDRAWCWYLTRSPRVIWAFAVLVGLLTLIGGLVPSERHRVHAITDPLGIPATAAATAVGTVAGLLLMRLAAGLRKRKRIAWAASVGVSSIL